MVDIFFTGLFFVTYIFQHRQRMHKFRETNILILFLPGTDYITYFILLEKDNTEHK